MGKRERQPKKWFRVAGHGHDAPFMARTVAHAVAQFRRKFCVTLQTDKETGGWKGLSTECKPEYSR